MTRRLTLLVTLVFIAACGGEAQIPARKIGSIMPSAADAPKGTEIDAANAGPRTLEEFVTDPDVRIKLSMFRFRFAYVASFDSPTFVPDKTTPLGSSFYGTSAILLEDGESARAAFRYYSERLRGRSKGFNPIVLDEELGDEAFAFRFSELDDTPLPGLAMLFRVGNALFSVVGIGNPGPDPAVARSLVAKIATRASEAA
ncbi:MAG TPA: hypothetical protein VJ922_04525 [Actinomycetota bacterium]|nr:hypothetical protein [Actinomycetota bacterium]